MDKGKLCCDQEKLITVLVCVQAQASDCGRRCWFPGPRWPFAEGTKALGGPKRESRAHSRARENGCVRVCVGERERTSREQRIACASRPPCLLPNPTKVGRCPGYRRPRALDAGCSQFPHQGRLSKTWHGFQGELVICLVSCRLERAWQAARDWGRRIARRQGESPVPASTSGYGCRNRRRLVSSRPLLLPHVKKA